MKDTYLDAEGRECARLRFATHPRTDSDELVIRRWRRWVITRWGQRWQAWNYGEREIYAPTLAELRRKLVEEDTP